MTEQTTSEPQGKASIFLIFGEDNFSSNQKLKFYQDGFSKKYGEDSNIEALDGKKLDIKNFETDLQSLPFLSEKKMIVIKDLFAERDAEEQKEVAKIIEKTPEFCVLIFYETANVKKTLSLYKKIAQIGKIEVFPALSPQESAQWIMKKAKQENIKISIITAKILADRVSGTLWTLTNEYEKLKTFANGEEITKAMVEELVLPNISASIFHMTDFIGGKKQKEAISTFELIEESEGNAPQIFFMIVRHFRLLIQTFDMLKRGESQQSIMKKLGIQPFVVPKMASQCKNFTEKDLIEIYKKLLKIDTDFKTGQIKTSAQDNSHHKLAIEKFIIDCCKKN
ncbi:MAG: DNA polymerase III subunit delta [Candidatus Peregrinibacteria bacterium]|nr:DNA polymerase III subunit delta [Candidatus Peregrinibacteria bacterium]